jgi:hypothetical protein
MLRPQAIGTSLQNGRHLTIKVTAGWRSINFTFLWGVFSPGSWHANIHPKRTVVWLSHSRPAVLAACCCCCCCCELSACSLSEPLGTSQSLNWSRPVPLPLVPKGLSRVHIIINHVINCLVLYLSVFVYFFTRVIFVTCELGNEPSGSIKCWELPRGCISCGLSSGTQLHRVS